MRNIDHIMEESEIGFARHKIIYDENGKASDYEFITVNTAFEKLTGLKKADILNRSVKQVIPTIIEDEFDWIDYYGKIEENEEKKIFEQYAPAMDKWYRVEAFSHQKGYFTTLFTDITHERELAEASKEFLNDETEHNTYERITQRMKKICGADYVTLNIFSKDEERFVMTAITTIPSALQRVTQILGFDPQNKEWTPDPYLTNQIRNNRVTTFSSLYEMAQCFIPKTVAKLLEKTFNLGKVVILKSAQGDRLIGDFTLMFSKGKDLENENEAIIYADMVGMLIQKRNRQRELEENEERLSRAIEGTGAGLWDWDMVKDRVFFSKSWKKMLGYEEHEVKNDFSGWKSLWHPEDASRIEKAINDYLEGKTDVYEIEHRLRHKDGSWHWISTRGDIERDRTGKAVRWTGTNIDITESKNQLFETERLKEQFELAVSGTNDGIWDWNLLTNELFLSKRWKGILGYEDREIKNEFKSFLSLLYEEDAERVNDFVQRYLQGEIEQYAIEFRMKHKNGSPIWILARGEALRDETGKPYRMAGSHSDISKRKAVEKRLKENQIRLELAMDAGEHGFWDWNLITNETYFSPTYYTMLGYKNQEIPMTPDTFMHLIHPEDARTKMPIIQKSITKGKAYEVEFRLKCKNGQYKWILGKGKSYFENETGKPNRAVGVHIDIHDRKKMEQVLKKSKEQAEAANKAKSEFLANMSHEIRTPLNGIIGFSDLLQRSNLTDKQNEYMNAVKNSADALLDIINDILDFSKIEAGKMDLNPEKTDIIKLCENIIDIVRFRAEENGIELLLDIKREIPRYAWVDSVRLKQILINLLGNAIKFTEKGQVELKVYKSETIGQKTGTLFFAVEDTGIGISKKHQNRIFEAFAQEDISTTKKFGGTGLGLTISSQLLKMMGTQLKLKSELGKGSIFSFALTVKTENSEEKKHFIPDDMHSVLIIDDNPDSRTILREVLEPAAIKVTEAINGFVGLEILTKNRRFDLLIIDYHMPYMNGIEVVKTIREKFEISARELPVILLHSSAENEDLRKACQKYDITANLLKPFKMTQLLQVLSEIQTKDDSHPDNGEAQSENIVKPADVKKVYKKILIAEDNATNMLFAKTALSLILPNVTIREAKNGKEAVRIARAEAPDLIFMDVRMPKLDGYKATRRIREFDKKTRIIALTAGVIKGEKERCSEAGMNDYLPKPVTIDSIEKALFENLPTAEKTQNPVKSPEIKPAVFNRKVLADRLGGQEDFIRQTLMMFRDDLIMKIDRLKKLNVYEEKPETLHFIFHSIKGQAANLCFEKLAEASETLEALAAGGKKEEIANKMGHFLSLLRKCLEIVRKEIP